MTVDRRARPLGHEPRDRWFDPRVHDTIDDVSEAAYYRLPLNDDYLIDVDPQSL